MKRSARENPFDSQSEPAAQRIAVGLQKVGLALKQQTWLQANDEGLSPTQGQILAMVQTAGGVRAGELARRLGITAATVSDAVRVLVDKGFLQKKPDPEDARASLLQLTPSGVQLAAKASGWPAFLESAAEAMSEREQSAFLSGLSKMIRALQESGQIPVQRMCVCCVYFAADKHVGDKPHHCNFVDAPMGDQHLRMDCAEHQVVPISSLVRR